MLIPLSHHPRRHYPSLFARGLSNIFLFLTTAANNNNNNNSKYSPAIVTHAFISPSSLPSSLRRHYRHRSLTKRYQSSPSSVSGVFPLGRTDTNSPHLTHYIATGEISVSDAVSSILPRALEKDTASARAPPTIEDEFGSIIVPYPPKTTAAAAGAPLSAEELLLLGSVWFMSQSDLEKPPEAGVKTTRLGWRDGSKLLRDGDYLRVHHVPRRFPVVYSRNWTLGVGDVDDAGKKGVIVARDDEKGYVIVNKPAKIPIHCTVDNQLENVSEALRRSIYEENKLAGISMPSSPPVVPSSSKQQQQKKVRNNHPVKVYVAQRLDIETSGLICLPTRKEFAVYFSNLLKEKTFRVLSGDSDDNEDDFVVVKKKYSCLVCLCPHGDTTLQSELSRLQNLNNTILTHYLSPSRTAPKIYKHHPPGQQADLRITHIYPSITVTDTNPLFWSNPKSIPPHCQAVIPLEVELLTGRTHQIRGQLSLINFPLVGDTMYGGAVAGNDETATAKERLALYCCELSFRDAENGDWKRWRCDDTWWNEILSNCTTGGDDEMKVRQLQDKINAAADVTEGSGTDFDNAPAVHTPEKLAPPFVSLSPGSNKYVYISATTPRGKYHFVKSATPYESGGPYHADVARDVVDHLIAAEFDNVKVLGGGRIRYDRKEGTVEVFGFSYGFGRGDHKFVAELIEREWGVRRGVRVTWSDDKSLY